MDAMFHLFLIMSLTALLHEAVVPQQVARPYVRQHKYAKVTIDADLDQGERLQTYMIRLYGPEATADFLQQATGTTCGKPMPYGFYRTYIEQELTAKFTNAKRESLRRSLKAYARMKETGAVTRLAFRGDRKRASFRGPGGKHN